MVGVSLPLYFHGIGGSVAVAMFLAATATVWSTCVLMMFCTHACMMGGLTVSIAHRKRQEDLDKNRIARRRTLLCRYSVLSRSPLLRLRPSLIQCGATQCTS